MTVPPPRRFVTLIDPPVDVLPWGPHEWLSRPGLTDAEKLGLVRVTMPAGTGHDFHRHPEMEEIIYVVSGRAEQWVEKESRILVAGEVAHIPTNQVHATFNPGPGSLTFLAILSPAASVGPALVDVSGEEPWRTLRSKNDDGGPR